MGGVTDSLTNMVGGPNLTGGNIPGAPPGQPNIPGPDQQAAGPLQNRNIIWKGNIRYFHIHSSQ